MFFLERKKKLPIVILFLVRVISVDYIAITITLSQYCNKRGNKFKINTLGFYLLALA